MGHRRFKSLFDVHHICKEVKKMDILSDYLASIKDPLQRKRLDELFDWILRRFPNLVPKIAWNQPMFTDHETFIIAFSVAKNHMSVAPERAGMMHFSDDIIKAGYDQTKELIRIRWNQPIDFSLLEKIIEFNIMDKAFCNTFWRK